MASSKKTISPATATQAQRNLDNFLGLKPKMQGKAAAAAGFKVDEYREVLLGRVREAQEAEKEKARIPGVPVPEPVPAPKPEPEPEPEEKIEDASASVLPADGIQEGAVTPENSGGNAGKEALVATNEKIETVETQPVATEKAPAKGKKGKGKTPLPVSTRRLPVANSDGKVDAEGVKEVQVKAQAEEPELTEEGKETMAEEAMAEEILAIQDAASERLAAMDISPEEFGEALAEAKKAQPEGDLLALGGQVIEALAEAKEKKEAELAEKARVAEEVRIKKEAETKAKADKEAAVKAEIAFKMLLKGLQSLAVPMAEGSKPMVGIADQAKALTQAWAKEDKATVNVAGFVQRELDRLVAEAIMAEEARRELARVRSALIGDAVAEAKKQGVETQAGRNLLKSRLSELAEKTNSVKEARQGLQGESLGALLAQVKKDLEGRRALLAQIALAGLEEELLTTALSTNWEGERTMEVLAGGKDEFWAFTELKALAMLKKQGQDLAKEAGNLRLKLQKLGRTEEAWEAQELGLAFAGRKFEGIARLAELQASLKPAPKVKPAPVPATEPAPVAPTVEPEPAPVFSAKAEEARKQALRQGATQEQAAILACVVALGEVDMSLPEALLLRLGGEEGSSNEEALSFLVGKGASAVEAAMVTALAKWDEAVRSMSGETENKPADEPANTPEGEEGEGMNPTEKIEAIETETIETEELLGADSGEKVGDGGAKVQAPAEEPEPEPAPAPAEATRPTFRARARILAQKGKEKVMDAAKAAAEAPARFDHLMAVKFGGKKEGLAAELSGQFAHMEGLEQKEDALFKGIKKEEVKTLLECLGAIQEGLSQAHAEEKAAVGLASTKAKATVKAAWATRIEVEGAAGLKSRMGKEDGPIFAHYLLVLAAAHAARRLGTKDVLVPGGKIEAPEALKGDEKAVKAFFNALSSDKAAMKALAKGARAVGSEKLSAKETRNLRVALAVKTATRPQIDKVRVAFVEGLNATKGVWTETEGAGDGHLPGLANGDRKWLGAALFDAALAQVGRFSPEQIRVLWLARTAPSRLVKQGLVARGVYTAYTTVKLALVGVWETAKWVSLPVRALGRVTACAAWEFAFPGKDAEGKANSRKDAAMVQLRKGKELMAQMGRQGWAAMKAAKGGVVKATKALAVRAWDATLGRIFGGKSAAEGKTDEKGAVAPEKEVAVATEKKSWWAGVMDFCVLRTQKNPTPSTTRKVVGVVTVLPRAVWEGAKVVASAVKKAAVKAWSWISSFFKKAPVGAGAAGDVPDAAEAVAGV